MRHKISIFSSSEFKDQVFHLRVHRRVHGVVSGIWYTEVLGYCQVWVPLEPRFQVKVLVLVLYLFIGIWGFVELGKLKNIYVFGEI